MTASGCEDIFVNAESDVLHLHSIRVTVLAVLLTSTANIEHPSNLLARWTRCHPAREVAHRNESVLSLFP
jgi:hypothetical protein